MTSTTPRAERPRIPSNPGGRKANGFRARLLSCCCGLALLLGSPVVARADSQADDSDARLMSYPTKAGMEKNGVAPTWMLFIALSVISCSVLFKNAKR